MWSADTYRDSPRIVVKDHAEENVCEMIVTVGRAGSNETDDALGVIDQYAAIAAQINNNIFHWARASMCSVGRAT